MKKLTRFSVLGLTALLGLGVLAACSGGGGNNADSGSSAINVVSREEGSGTRGAFIELFGVEEKDDSGEKVDKTSAKAMITNSTAVMLTTVAGDKQAIGYVSMGSLDDSVKALSIDGAKPTVDQVKDGSYKISRPFNIVLTEKVSEPAQDFINFIMSKEGQAVVEDSGYISIEEGPEYKSSVDSGKIVISGSSSVTPVMEKLKEAYLKVNSGVTIEIQQSDSSTGIRSAIDSTADIGMSSRELKDEETSEGISATAIALDGIAVVVNKENSLEELTSEQVKAIFVGETTAWDALSEK